MYFDNSVSLEYFSLRKDFIWCLYRTLNSFDIIPMCRLVSVLSVVVISALYMMFEAKQFPGIGLTYFFQQLHLF